MVGTAVAAMAKRLSDTLGVVVGRLAGVSGALVRHGCDRGGRGEAEVCGRDEPGPGVGLVERCLETVRTNSLLLVGGPRAARAAVHQELRCRLRDAGDAELALFPVYVDLRGTPGDRFFARVAESMFHELARDLRGVAAHADTASPRYGYRELLRDLRRVLRSLEEERGRRVKLVLLIDDADRLDEYDPRVNQKLRSVFMKSFAESLAAVVSARGIGPAWKREGSPWYNFFEVIQVGSPARDPSLP